ncbi:c-type cytochrome biogenesis protein CcmI [Alisedimentitalea sp. MJ-SS2]|uniref:c-type cytochrome biogenesis protein CcmI n=1 Tax=Aliisedimentitalea sp. MJ-SS2 TaxID=3049795 RepID=UPI0029129DA7|nr:c-type cytochrome biogenesis protein CcmI [Alisedimentitalea sp. MJ-SS2]MDU8929967.1 c-type cytochrome biogenesis protein CcmI [Alisedimentitalea sp. MJ-SS2]
MLFWSIVLLIALIAGLWLAQPFLRRGVVEVNDSDSAISVYRDQMDEIDRDLATGLIGEEERDAAMREIERRALGAARHMDGGFTVSHRSLPVTGALVAVCVAVALGGYALTGAPGTKDQPLAARKMEVLSQRAKAGDTNAQIALMIEKTKDNPDSFEDWWMLATSYSSLGDHASAVEAYRKAAELGGDQPAVQSAYAEAMVMANGNKVPPAARLIFEQVLNRGPDVRARYYLALQKAQSQNFQAALDDWTALARDSVPDAPWMPMVRRDIVNMARFLKVEVTDYLPEATPEEIAKSGGQGLLSPADSSTRIAKLRAGLAEEPHNYKASIELATLLAQGGDDTAAVAVLNDARQSYAAAPFVLDKIEQAARATGLDMLDGNVNPAVSGPTHEDVVAAQGMTAQETDEMVDGMVAGLAAKLEENPDNPDGWVMLVRSYAVMGHPDKARAALDRATAFYAGNAEVLTRLEAQARAMIGAD